MRREKKPYSITCLIAIAMILLNSVSWAAEGKPQTAKYVDYVAELNKLGMAGRSENLNAAPFYQKAVELHIRGSEEQMKLVSQKGWPADFSAGEQQLLRKWVQSNSQALSQLELGSKKPYYWAKPSSPDGTAMSILMPGLADYRNLSRAITLRAKFSAAEGDIDKALTDVVTGYRFGLHLQTGGYKTLIEQLVGIAVRAMAIQAAFDILDRTKPNKDLLAALQKQIEGLSTNESYIPDFRSEKIMMLDIIQRIFTDDGKGDGEVDLPSAKLILSTVELPVPPEGLRRRQTIETTEKLYKYLDSIAQKTPWQWKTENINPDQDIKQIIKENSFVRSFEPPTRIVEIFARCRADSDGLITTLALLRYKADKGQFPEKFDELVSAGYLKSLRSDPFSGKPFVYKRIGESFGLYSVGRNLKDDDGKTAPDAKGEPKRWTDDGDAVFWPVPK